MVRKIRESRDSVGLIISFQGSGFLDIQSRIHLSVTIAKFVTILHGIQFYIHFVMKL